MAGKEYDFSDFDAPAEKSESPQYDFSDFDGPAEAEAPESKSIDEDIDRISASYGVDKDWLKSRQIGMGYYPESEAQQLLSEGKTGEHFARAASSSVNSVVGEGVLGGLPTWINKKVSSQNEEAAIDELRKAVDRHKSGGSLVREAVLSATPAVLGAKALGLGTKGVTALNIGESARAGLMESDQGEELGGLGTGATVGAAFEALPVVGKGIKAAKRLIPGTENALPAVNKFVSRAAKINPAQSGSADDIERMLSETTSRRTAKSKDLADEAMQLAPKLDDAKTAVNDGVERRFRNLEEISLVEPDLGADLGGASDIFHRLEDEILFLEQNQQFFGKSPMKLAADVKEIMHVGGPREAGAPSYKIPVKELAAKVGVPEAGQVLRLRALHARRHVDDVMKNKNWDNLLSGEQEAIRNLRTILDENLKVTFGGAQERLQADRIYSEAKRKTDELFKPLEQLDPNGLRNTSPEKLNNFLKSQSVRGSVFDRRVEQFSKYLKEAEREIGNIPEAQEALVQLEKARELGGMQRLLDNMTRASGGPTSQAMNAAMQLGTGFATGGATVPAQILLYPITNPRGWVELVDSLGKPLWDSITAASTAFMKTQPTIATRLYLLSQADQEGKSDPKPQGASTNSDVDARMDAEIYKKYVTDQQAEDPFAKKVGPGADMVQDIDNWSYDKIARPLAGAGFPRAGAAAAAVPSTIADLVIPQTAGDYMPLGAAVHVGRKFPFQKWMNPKEGAKVRESLTSIGTISGKPNVMALKSKSEVDNVDRWLITEFGKGDKSTKVIGQVDISWERGSPTVEYFENKSGGLHKGLVGDFLDKFTERTGQVTSSMMFEPTDGRLLGKELWEERLGRVVEMQDDSGDVFYRMLGKKEFDTWQKANPEVVADGAKRAAVGEYPGPVWSRIRDTKVRRESTERIGNIGDDLTVMARKRNAGPVNPGQKVDVWEVTDHFNREKPTTLHEIKVNWSKGNAVVDDLGDYQNSVRPEMLAAFLDKLSDKLGSITSGPVRRDASKWSTKWYGDQPKWEQNESFWHSLPRVVEVPDVAGTVRYRMLGEAEYKRWLQANPKLWLPQAK